MCYDGMLRFMKSAKAAIESKDIEKKVKFVNKTIAIVDELQNSLDFVRGGEVARNLDRVYDYFNHELMKVGMHNDIGILDHLLKLTVDLRGAWAKIAAENPPPPQEGTPKAGITITG